jgi:hypothetical protein
MGKAIQITTPEQIPAAKLFDIYFLVHRDRFMPPPPPPPPDGEISSTCSADAPSFSAPFLRTDRSHFATWIDSPLARQA